MTEAHEKFLNDRNNFIDERGFWTYIFQSLFCAIFHRRLWNVPKQKTRFDVFSETVMKNYYVCPRCDIPQEKWINL